MIKVKDTKLSADIDDDVTEYVTFWGKLKGDIKKQKDLVEAKKELSSSKTISKTEKKRLKMKINYLQREIVELREIRDIMLNDFSYGNCEAKSGEGAGYNTGYQFNEGTPNHGENSEQRISNLECVNKRLKKYLDLFNKDGQQDDRRGERSR